MLLTQIQRRLANLYEAHTEYDIYDFLITDRRLVGELAKKSKRSLVLPPSAAATYQAGCGGLDALDRAG